MILQQQAHSTFSWHNDDLHMTMTISLKQALLGFKKSVQQTDGRTIYIDSSEVVSPDQILVVKGEGLYADRPGTGEARPGCPGRRSGRRRFYGV